jgi:hypothetical protein
MDMEEEVEAEEGGEPDEMDMSVWEYTSACVLQWYVEGNTMLQSKVFLSIKIKKKELDRWGDQTMRTVWNV